ncbi:imm11 family protein [Clostridium septicum]|uniref:Immunity MXAN-0049 protein domain-containing protein n=1 Tax=Clostridium septicum TaxID=1504 RepID=A0A9N7PIT4_CLOSE|nr:DUF1629 domain-containing protein [Clostridium septicum]AYE33971.1 hypothetical protein CP523_05545 [Clostridium septicum]MDU1315425.1 hypothetical protein [Clostridium septicum]QAS59367.1 hypothetical protein EI377_00180 [Clostridium septicum]UEC21411.1 hypothetical protein LK444_03285 [Clostridium septicum]USS00542.1 hypothetical protein NH397_13800 [Clostridium septicum]
MKIWSLEEDVNHYEHITLDDRNNLNWIDFGDMFNGKSLKDNWTPIRVCLIEHGGKLKKGDMPYLSPGKPIFSKSAVTILKDLLEGYAEILPIEYDLQELFIINVTNHIEAINYEKSDVEYMRDGKRILSVNKYYFKIEVVKKQHIFKIVNQLNGTVFVSDDFRNRVIEGGLQGFKFVEVWDSEE